MHKFASHPHKIKHRDVAFASFNHPIHYLPSSLSVLILSGHFSVPIVTLPVNLTQLIFLPDCLYVHVDLLKLNIHNIAQIFVTASPLPTSKLRRACNRK